VFGIFDIISYTCGPSRRTAKSIRNSNGVHGNIRFDNQLVGYESGLEKLFACMMALDPQVEAITHQPMTYQYEVTTISKKLNYTPDYLVERDLSKPWIWGDSIVIPPSRCLYEVKPIEKLRKMSPIEGGPRASLICEIQKSGGYGFHFFTNQTIPRHQSANVLRVSGSNPDELGLNLGKEWLHKHQIGDQISIPELASQIGKFGVAPWPIVFALMKSRRLAGSYHLPSFWEGTALILAR
jgi:hypothetical protein